MQPPHITARRGAGRLLATQPHGRVALGKWSIRRSHPFLSPSCFSPHPQPLFPLTSFHPRIHPRIFCPGRVKSPRAGLQELETVATRSLPLDLQAWRFPKGLCHFRAPTSNNSCLPKDSLQARCLQQGHFCCFRCPELRFSFSFRIDISFCFIICKIRACSLCFWVFDDAQIFVPSSKRLLCLNPGEEEEASLKNQPKKRARLILPGLSQATFGNGVGVEIPSRAKQG